MAQVPGNAIGIFTSVGRPRRMPTPRRAPAVAVVALALSTAQRAEASGAHAPSQPSAQHRRQPPPQLQLILAQPRRRPRLAECERAAPTEDEPKLRVRMEQSPREHVEKVRLHRALMALVDDQLSPEGERALW